MSLPLAMIAAVARNGVIGRDNDLPWHLPPDLRHFKAMTLGKPVILGRRTFDSLGGPLPGRHFVVLTRDTDWQHPGVEVAHSPEEALKKAEAIGQRLGAEEIMLAGGAEIYALFLDKATRFYRTLVECEPGGDARFPDLDEGWQLLSESRITDYEPPFSIQTLEKRF